jgi:hypothetical protein
MIEQMPYTTYEAFENEVKILQIIGDSKLPGMCEMITSGVTQ